jgi:transposase
MRLEGNALKMENLHDNAPEHRSILVEGFVTKNNVTTLELHPYSRDLAVADIYLFLRLKSALLERRFNATGIIKNVTQELKRLTQNYFQKCFQHFYSG